MGLRAWLLGVLLLLLAAAPARAHEGHPHHRDTIQELNFDFVGAIENGEQSIASGYGDAGLTYLPKRWCGTTRSTDNTADQVYDATLPQVKFVYAYASDQTDRTTPVGRPAPGQRLADQPLLRPAVRRPARAALRSRHQLRGGLHRRRHRPAALAALGLRRRLRRRQERGQHAASAHPRPAAQLRDPRRQALVAAQRLAVGPGLDVPDRRHQGHGQHPQQRRPELDHVDPGGADAAVHGGGEGPGLLARGLPARDARTTSAPSRPTPRTRPRQGTAPTAWTSCATPTGARWRTTRTSARGSAPSRRSSRRCSTAAATTTSARRPCPARGSTGTTTRSTASSTATARRWAASAARAWRPAVTGGPTVTGTTRGGNTLTGATGTWTGNPTLSYSWEEEVSGTWQPYANASLTLPLTSANVGRRYRAEGDRRRQRDRRGPLGTHRRRRPRRSSRRGAPARRSAATPSAATRSRRPTARGPTPPPTRTSGCAGTAPRGSRSPARRARRTCSRRPTSTSSCASVVTATSVDGVTASAQASNYVGPIKSGPINNSLPTVSGVPKVNQTLSLDHRHLVAVADGLLARLAARGRRRLDGDPGRDRNRRTPSRPTTSACNLRIAVTATNANGSTVADLEPGRPGRSRWRRRSTPPCRSSPAPPSRARRSPPARTPGPARRRRRSSGSAARAAAPGRRSPAPPRAPTSSSPPTSTATCARSSPQRTPTAATQVASDARGPVLTNVPPANSALPSISGTARTGQVLTATTGTWVRATTYDYAWQRYSGGTWAAIAGATASTYTPVQRRRRQARARRRHRDRPGRQHAGRVGADRRRRRPAREPVRAVDHRHGQARTARSPRRPGTWTNATAYAYQWQRQTSGTWGDIGGATASTYVPGAARRRQRAPRAGDGVERHRQRRGARRPPRWRSPT